MAFRPEFVEALNLLAEACEALVKQGLPRPVLVGGGAVEFYTGGAVASADFDLVFPDTPTALEEELIKLGFERPLQPGQLIKGLIHPKLLIGIEVVSGALMDGYADREKLYFVETNKGGVDVISVEDLIADRLGAYLSSPQKVPEMREQAVFLFNLATIIDEAYLSKRIHEETNGDLSLDDLKKYCDA